MRCFPFIDYSDIERAFGWLAQLGYYLPEDGHSSKSGPTFGAVQNHETSLTNGDDNDDEEHQKRRRSMTLDAPSGLAAS